MENNKIEGSHLVASQKKQKSRFLNFFSKKRWYFLLAFVAIAIVGIVFAGQGNDDKFSFTEVQRGDLIQTVEVSGELESFMEADLAFEMSGTVSQVFVGAGDEVLEGQVIAILDSGELLADLSAAQQSVFLAEANLNKYLAGATDQELASAMASLDSAKADLVSKKELAEINVADALISLDTARDSLENISLDNTEDAEQLYEDLENLLFSAVIDVRSALSSADEILGVENSLTNQDFKNVLSATDPQQYTSAKYYYNYASDARDVAEDLVYLIDEDSAQGDIDSAADKVEEALSYTSETLLYTRRVLDATKSDSSDLSLSDISTYKTAIDAERDTIQVEQTSVMAQRQLIDTTLISINTTDDSASHTFDSAEQDYALAISNAESSVAIAQASVDKYQAEYDSLTTEKRSVDTASYYAQLGQANAQMSASEARFKKSEIRSPFNGIITHVDLSTGEAVMLGTAVAGVQSNIEQYRVLVDIPEADIVKVAIDDFAILTFDAYGDDIEVDAYVGNINPGESDIEGVVYYQVEIYIDENVDLMLKSGMSADVIITTEVKEDVLYLQQRAIYEYKDGVRYVRVQDSNEYVENVVVTGLRADGGFLEIISGLEESDRVITSINN